MPRAKIDVGRMQERILDVAELILAENRGRRLIVADIARELSMSQPNLHRYFGTKADLIAGLAERWFAHVHKAAREAVDAGNDPRARVTGWVLAIRAVKCERYDADPQLFRAYLDLAADHLDIAVRHAGDLRHLVEAPVSDLVGEGNERAALDLLEDATVQFRNPYMIAMHRNRATEAAARRAIEAVLTAFDHAPWL